MSDSNLRSRLNIHGIVDLDQMAAILTSLVDQVDKQNKTIGDLQKSLSLYVTNQTFVDRVSKLESTVSDMCTRIDAIQEAATATVLNKKISAGNLASSNFKQINYLAKIVSECATKIELETHRKDLSVTQWDLNVLRKDFDTSLGVIDQLSNSQYSQSQRISALESSVAGKIDRSEVDHLQSLVAKVLLYDAFKTDTTDALRQLHAFRLSALDRLGGLDKHQEVVDEEVRALHEGLSLTASKRDVKALALELQMHDDLIRLCATKDALSLVEADLGRTRHHITQSDARILTLEEQAGQIINELETKATVVALRECVTRRHYEQAVAALGAELELKCKQTTVSTLQSKVTTLEEKVKVEADRLAVAMRFVDWFTSRGENY
eukprot:gene25732-29070_t